MRQLLIMATMWANAHDFRPFGIRCRRVPAIGPLIRTSAGIGIARPCHCPERECGSCLGFGDADSPSRLRQLIAGNIAGSARLEGVRGSGSVQLGAADAGRVVSVDRSGRMWYVRGCVGPSAWRDQLEGLAVDGAHPHCHKHLFRRDRRNAAILVSVLRDGARRRACDVAGD